LQAADNFILALQTAFISRWGREERERKIKRNEGEEKEFARNFPVIRSCEQVTSISEQMFLSFCTK